MVIVSCDNEECEKFGTSMELIEEDDRQEWYKGYYECSKCGQEKTHHIVRDENGLVKEDEITKD